MADSATLLSMDALLDAVSKCYTTTKGLLFEHASKKPFRTLNEEPSLSCCIEVGEKIRYRGLFTATGGH